MSSAKILNKRIFYWGSKPLGLECFRFLLSLVKEKNLDAKIIGICISKKDLDKDGANNQDIGKIARENKIPVFTEHDPITLIGDLGICIGYPHKIPLETISKYKNGVINLHFAPLPYYRGSKTLTHAMLNKEESYGLTFHYIDEKLDTGPIIALKWYRLPTNKTAGVITKELEKLAFEFFTQYALRMLEKKLPAIPQEDIIRNKNIKPKFYTRDSIDKLYKISPTWSFEKIYRTVKALSLDNKRLPYMEKGGIKIFLSID